MNFFEHPFPHTQKFVHYEYLNLQIKNKIHFIFIEYKLIHSTNLHSIKRRTSILSYKTLYTTLQTFLSLLLMEYEA